MSDNTRTNAVDLGNITSLAGPEFPNASLDGDGDSIDYFRFTLTEAKMVGLGLRRQDANADLFLEDADGNVLYSSTETGTANEWLEVTLLAGTYYVRVEAQETGENNFKLRYGVTAADPDALAALEQQQQVATDAPPAFGAASYAFALAENADGSTNRVSLGTVSATDPEDATVTYSIEGGNAAGLFEIDAATGALSYTGAGEDYESGATSYALTVRASDSSLHTDVTVTVGVTDAAEAPGFARAGYTFDLAENTDGSTSRVLLGSVLATDPEGTNVEYSLTAGNSAGLFELDAATGELFYTGSGEDFESGSTQFDLTVRASDETQSTDTTVTVNITDVQEQVIVEPPVLETQLSVSEPDGEDLPTNTSTVGRVAVGGIATGTIGTSGDRDWFAVDLVADRTYIIDLRGSPTGDGTLSDPYLRGINDADGRSITNTANDDGGEGYNSRLTFTPTESGAYYIAAGAYSNRRGAYEVEVTDTSPPVSEQQRSIDEPPVFGTASYAFDLAENADGSTNRVSLGTVSATDPEDATVSYSIEGGNAAGLFEIDAATGALSYTGAGEDYESGATSYALTVRASDSSLHTDVIVTVGVTDAAEAPGFARAGYTFDLAENTDGSTSRVLLGSVSATDPEGTNVEYSLTAGNGAGLFELDTATGELFYTGSGEDFESGTTSYELTVRASDGGLHTDASVTISVTDVEEHATTEPPVPETQLSVSEPDGEDLPTNTSTVGRVAVGGVATGNIGTSGDRDWFAVDLVADRTYIINLRGSSTGDGTLRDTYLRGINDADGNLISGTTNDDGGIGYNSRLAFTPTESGAYYIAAGGYSNRRGTYEVKVTDQQQSTDEPPVFSQQRYGFELNEDTDGSTQRVRFGGVGAVASDGAEPTYSLVAGNDAGLFEIGAATGRLFYIGSGEDYESGTTRYELTVRASSGEMSADASISVRVNDLEEDRPADTSTTGVVAVGGSVTGNIGTTNDQDWFAVTLEADRTYQIDMKGSVTGSGTLSDPYLRGIYDSNGTLIAGTSDNDGGFHDNSRVVFTASEDATYYVAAGANGNGVGTYTVEVTDVVDDFTADTGTTGTVAVGSSVTGEIETPDDRDWFAVTLEAGKTYRFDLAGSNTESGTLWDPYLRGIYDSDGTLIAGTSNNNGGYGADSQVLFSASETATYYVAAGAGAGSRSGYHTGTYTLRVTESVDDFTAGTDTTGTVAVGGSTTGEIGGARDRDWFAVTLEAGKTYRIDMEGSRTDQGTMYDPYLRGIHDSDGALIAGTSDDGSGHLDNSQVLFTASETATYYVAAGSNGRAGDVGTYTLRVTEAEDDFTADTYTTGTVAVGVPATGGIDTPNDRDWFAVTLEAGKTYQVDLEGGRDSPDRPYSDRGGTLQDPYLYGVHDSDGTLIVDTSDDDSGRFSNSQVFFTASETATYYVAAGAVEPSSSFDNGVGTYTLSVAEIPDDFSADTDTTGTVAVGGSATGEFELENDRDWFAVTLEAGKTYQVDMEGPHSRYLHGIHDSEGTLIAGPSDSGQPVGSQVFFTASETATYYVAAGRRLETSFTSVISPYTLRVTDVTDDFTDDTDTTGTVTVGGSAMGEIKLPNDRDWFAVTFEAGKTYQVDLEGVATGSNTLSDPYLHGIYDSDGTLIAGTSDNDGDYHFSSQVLFTASETATYYVGAGSRYDCIGTYTLRVTDVTDDFTAGTDTIGTVAVGDSATGEIGGAGDRDWFAVTLEAGKTYRIDMEGSRTGYGTLYDPYLRGIHDSDGALIAGTSDDNSGHLSNSRVLFTASETATYYVAAGSNGGEGDDVGAYTLSVEEMIDEPPVFGRQDYVFALAENADGSANRVSLGTVSAADPEGEALEYSLVSGNEAGLFELDTQTGELFYTGAGEDYESGATQFDLTVRASDETQSTDTAVTAYITDIDERVIDEPPAFGQQRYGFELNEDTDGSTQRVRFGGVRAVASDGAEPTYSLVAGNDAGLFEIGAATGRLFYIGSGEDYESGTTRYELTVRASSGEMSADASISVRVNDLEEDRPADTSTTGVVAVGGSVTGNIGTTNDQDWFAVTLEADKTYQIDMKGSATGSGRLSDPYLRGIYDSNGTLIAGTSDNDGGHGNNSRVFFTVSADATYYVAAGANGNGGGTYTVEVAEVVDDFTADTGTTGTVAVGSSVTGEIEALDDRDWFAVTLEAGKTYRFDLAGSNTSSGTLGDPYLRGIYDSDGTLIAGTSNNNAGYIADSRVFFSASETATYYVAAGAGSRYDNRIGTYTLRVTESVDDFTAGTDTTGTVAVGGSATGEIGGARDRDWFAVTLEAGKTYRIDMEGSRTGQGTMYDPYLRGIHDSDGALIAGTSDDNSGLQYNSQVLFTASETATYYVAAAGGNRDVGAYTLRVTEAEDDFTADTDTTGTVVVGGSATGGIDTPNDRDWFAVTLEAGKTYQVDLEGAYTDSGTLRDPYLYGVYDSDGTLIVGTSDDESGYFTNSQAFFTASETATYYVAAGADEPIISLDNGVGAYTLSVVEIPDDFSADTDTTGTVTVGDSATGEIELQNDRDWFAVTLEAGKTYQVDLEGLYSDSGTTLPDPYLHGIYDSDGTLIANTNNDNSGYNLNSQVFFTASEDSTYYVAAGISISGLAYSVGTYTLSVEEVVDGI